MCLEICTRIRVHTTSLEFVAGENLVLALVADSRPVCPMIVWATAGLIEPRACAGIDGRVGPYSCIAREGMRVDKSRTRWNACTDLSILNSKNI